MGRDAGDQAEQVLRGLGFGEGFFIQLDAQVALNAQQQLHPRQTVEAIVAFQGMVQAEPLHVAQMRMQFAGQAAHKVKQSLRIARGGFGHLLCLARCGHEALCL
ncbi:MAG TPA: hypothetical protein VFK88_00995 [Gallionella sp.]|nr:hypothetical protein [Gallionella sp.]